ncbi:MAG: NAD(P)H-hydrate dehydratase [Actinobacteria bacterium]|nr:NAD(P)H-hydrate dehydratase [Actinomycetota bacterium]
MIPVVTPAEMRAIDAAAPEPVAVLIERAGAAVARAALAMMGGAYGRRVIVIAGPGNNGADGRAAGARLERRGVRVQLVDADVAGGRSLPSCDLVIDAAYGTGFRDGWHPPDIGAAPVLAVDIPSGVDGMTGEVTGKVLAADRTVTFAALKPGLLFGRGAELSGDVEIADIGLDVSAVVTQVMEDSDVAAWFPRRPRAAHKWMTAVWVVAGSPGMAGAAALATRGAQRAGAGYVRQSSPGVEPTTASAPEAVGFALPALGWADEVIANADRFSSMVVGPGMGREPTTMREICRLVAGCPLPTVVDGDGLVALCREGSGAESLAGRVQPATVLTPHDGEYLRLTGAPVGPDRLAAARGAARAAGCTVLLKGPTTIVTDRTGEALLVTSGDARLATAGSGDVLSGVIAALLARGMRPLEAAASAAHLHGRAAGLGSPQGLVAGDVAEYLPAALHVMLAKPRD